MKTSFEIISSEFARRVLGNKLTGDPIKDALRAVHMNHPIKTGKSTRLKKWAIFRASGSTLASDLVGYPGGDTRTLKEAFVAELIAFKEPVVFSIFTNALLNAEDLRATYDIRRVALCSPSGVDMVNVMDPQSPHWLAKAYREEIKNNAA